MHKYTTVYQRLDTQTPTNLTDTTYHKCDSTYLTVGYKHYKKTVNLSNVI